MLRALARSRPKLRLPQVSVAPTRGGFYAGLFWQF
jgi:hypothetical protein